MPRAETTRRSVLYPGQGRPGPQALEDGPMKTLMQKTAEGIEEAGGRWTSMVVRGDEDPASAAIHFTLGGKRYVSVVQPVDMPDRSLG